MENEEPINNEDQADCTIPFLSKEEIKHAISLVAQAYQCSSVDVVIVLLTALITGIAIYQEIIFQEAKEAVNAHEADPTNENEA